MSEGKKEVLLRFVFPERHADTGRERGLFNAAYALERSGALPADQHGELADLLRWLEKNLAIPDRFNRTKSKGYYHRNTKGISWLKSSADEHVRQLRKLAAVLESHGFAAKMIKTRNPGYVVYEDEHQMVAEPFRDLRT